MKNRIITILLAMILIGTIFQFFLMPPASSDLNNQSSLIVHDNIFINANNKFTPGNGVLRGNGTQGNPYIIENWSIEAKADHGILIRNTDAHFIIRNCYVYNATKSWPFRSGIFLYNVKNGKIENNRVKNNYNGIYLFNSNESLIIDNFVANNLYGIRLYNSDRNTLSNNNCNSNNYYGIQIRYFSTDNKILNNNCTSSNDSGIYIEDNSNYNLISTNTCIWNKNSGIYIDSTDNTIINNTCTSNVKDGISIIDNSNIVMNNTCSLNNFGGLLIDGKFNTIINNTCTSNTFSGIIIYDNSNFVKNNTCTSNNDDGVSIGSDSNRIILNTCTSNKNAGISITSAEDNFLSNNTCISNNEDGIYLKGSKNNEISSNTCNSNNNVGIVLQWGSENNVLSNNSCNNNLVGIEIYWSDSNRIKNNTCSSNDAGIKLSFSSENILLNNIMEQCGIILNGDLLDHWNTHNIDITNTINSEPVYYWKNVSEGTIPSGAGEVILANCSNIKIYDQDLVNASAGILLGFTSGSIIDQNICSKNSYYGIYLYNSTNNLFTNNTCTLNYFYGIYLDSSSDNIIDNCSIITNINFDLYSIDGSENNVALNTIFNTIDIPDPTSNLIIKYYLHIQTNYSENIPLEDVDIKIQDNNETVYATPGYGGYKFQTNEDGQIKWIKVTDRIYNGSELATENKTTIIVKYNNSMVIDNNREIEMEKSHFEFFYFNILPTKIILNSPLDKSYIRDPTPELIWTAGIDLEGEPIKYQVQIDELGDNWASLVSSNIINPGTLTWNIPTPIIDGDYQWRVNANDSIGNGTWSEVWSFTLDTQPPITNFTRPQNNQFYRGLDVISGIVVDPKPSSGVDKVEIFIKRLIDNYYWSGSNWGSEKTWLSTSGPNENEWEYNSSGLIWNSDAQYIIRAKVVDNANNENTPGIDITFYIDTDRPISTIDKPLNNTYLNNLSMISGKSIDIGRFGSGITKVEISIKKINDNLYWRKTGWGTEEYWSVVTGTTDWTYNSNNIFWLTDSYYRIRSRATDNVGNIEHPGQGNTFMYDDKAPKQSITINDGEIYARSTTAILSLDVEDSGSGSSIMAFSPDGLDWTAWESFNINRLIDLPKEDGEKTIYFKVQDLAGNIAESVVDTIILDTTPPEKLSIAINENAMYTNSGMVSLSLNASDLLSGINGITFSMDGIHWAPWEPFKFSRSISLSSGDGEKTVFFKVIDEAGNVAGALNDSIILDTTPPHSLSMAINEDKEKMDAELSLKLYAIDDLSGLDQMAFSTDGEHWTSWEPFNYESDIALLSNDDLKTIYFRVNDRGGNIAGSISYNLTVLESQPTDKSLNDIIYWGFLVIIIIIILITFSKLIIIRYKFSPHKIQSLTPVNPEPTNPMVDKAQEEFLSTQTETQEVNSTSMEEINSQLTETITISNPDLTNPIPPLQESHAQQQPLIPHQPGVPVTPIISQQDSSNIVPEYSSNMPTNTEHEISKDQ